MDNFYRAAGNLSTIYAKCRIVRVRGDYVQGVASRAGACAIDFESIARTGIIDMYSRLIKQCVAGRDIHQAAKRARPSS